MLRIAAEKDAAPYDISGVELTHEGERCNFDSFLKKYQLTDPALQQLAKIVRGTDTSHLDLTPQSAGLYAILLGLSQRYTDNHEMLAGRGRNGSYLPPPAQIRTCGTTAYGSCLGYVTQSDPQGKGVHF